MSYARYSSFDSRFIVFDPRAQDPFGPTPLGRISEAPKPPGRKQACVSCRQRKKKCNGELPICGTCVRAGNACFYTPATGMNGLHPTGRTWMPPIDSEPMRISGAEIASGADRPASQLQEPLSPGSSTRRFSATYSEGSSSLTSPSFGDPYPAGTGAQNLEPDKLTTTVPQISAYNPYLPLWGDQDPLIPLGGFNFGMESLPGMLTSAADQHPGLTPPCSSLLMPSTLDSANHSIPSRDQFSTLFATFIDRYHAFLPCLHQSRLRARIASDYEGFQSSPQFWAIAGCGAWHQHDDADLQQSEAWLRRACILIDENIKSVRKPLETLQGLVYVIYQAYLSASMVEMWVQLGKACRFVNLLGWDRIDGKGNFSPYAAKPSGEEEKEERRRVVWILFLLDRAMSCMTGWPLAMNDRQFMVSYPVPESRFQQSDLSVTAEPYSMNLAKLLRPDRMSKELPYDPMGFLFRGYALLGRIITCHNNLHDADLPNSAVVEFSELENALTRFYLLVHSGCSEPLDRPLHDRTKEVWLDILIGTCTILLYHPTVDAADPDKHRENRDTTSGFRRCVSAARKIVERIHEEAMYSMETLMNPFLLPSYFLVCRFLTITWHESKTIQDRNSIDTILMLIDRIGNRYGPLARKYRRSIMADVNRDPQTVCQLRRGTGSYLSEDCRS